MQGRTNNWNMACSPEGALINGPPLWPWLIRASQAGIVGIAGRAPSRTRRVQEDRS